MHVSCSLTTHMHVSYSLGSALHQRCMIPCRRFESGALRGGAPQEEGRCAAPQQPVVGRKLSRWWDGPASGGRRRRWRPSCDRIPTPVFLSPPAQVIPPGATSERRDSSERAAKKNSETPPKELQDTSPAGRLPGCLLLALQLTTNPKALCSSRCRGGGVSIFVPERRKMTEAASTI